MMPGLLGQGQILAALKHLAAHIAWVVVVSRKLTCPLAEGIVEAEQLIIMKLVGQLLLIPKKLAAQGIQL
ncbi:hypothetical protein D3C71_2240240 [compost metagenome]